MHPDSMKTGQYETVSSQVGKWASSEVFEFLSRMVDKQESPYVTQGEVNHSNHPLVTVGHVHDPVQSKISVGSGGYYKISAPDFAVGRETIRKILGLEGDFAVSDNEMPRLRAEEAQYTHLITRRSDGVRVPMVDLYIPADRLEAAFFGAKEKAQAKGVGRG